MADYNQASATVTAAQGISDLSGSISQAGATKAQGDFAKTQYDFNARLAQLQAEDERKRGVKRASKIREQGQQVAASQKAAFAAGGIDVSYGTPQQVVEDTAIMAGEDAVTEENNAWRTAWGFEAQASNYKFQGEMAKIAAKREAGATIATGVTRGITSGLAAGYYGNEAYKDYKVKKAAKK